MKLMEYLPEHFRQIKEFDILLSLEQIQADRAWSDTKKTFDEVFVDSASIFGVLKFEKQLGIATEKDTGSLYMRKLRILSAMAQYVPLTFLGIYERLESMMGKNNFIIDIDPARYYLKIRIRNSTKEAVSYIEKLFRDIIPANLVFITDLFSLSWRDVAQYSKTWVRIESRNLNWRELEQYYEQYA